MKQRLYRRKYQTLAFRFVFIIKVYYICFNMVRFTHGKKCNVGNLINEVTRKSIIPANVPGKFLYYLFY